jgi:hypothetical protein
MRCAEYVARMGRDRLHAEFWWRNLKERDHLDEKIILKWILRKQWKGVDCGHRQLADCCEHCDELSGSIDCG